MDIEGGPGPHRPEPAPAPNELPGEEREALLDFLEFYRSILAAKIDGLSAAQLRTTTAASSLTLAGLVKHLALVEDDWFTVRFAGRADPEPWASAPFAEDADWEFNSAVDDEPTELLDLFEAACARSRAVVATADSLDARSVTGGSGGRGPWNLRWILLHVIEEYARHCGHADLLREAVELRTGPR